MKNRGGKTYTRLNPFVVALCCLATIMTCAAQGAYVDVVDGLSPLGYWRLGESSGGTATDRAGSYNGAYSGGVSLGEPGALSGDSDTAVDFDGFDDVIEIGPSADLLLTGNLSVSLWFNADSFPTGASSEPLFTLTADAATSGTAKLAELAIDKNGDLVYTHEYGNQGSNDETHTFDTANLSFDTWYNLALIRDASAKDVYLYKDNSLLDTFSYTDQPEGYTEATLYIGGYLGSSFDGSMDEFAVFSSILTSQDVADIYNAATVPEPATVCLLGLGAFFFRKKTPP